MKRLSLVALGMASAHQFTHKIQAQKTMQKISERIDGLLRAAFYAENYRLPGSFVTTEEISLPSDQWNSGSDHRIRIPAGVRVEIVTKQHREAEEVYGHDADVVAGLWAERFSTGWPSEFAEGQETRYGWPDA